MTKLVALAHNGWVDAVVEQGDVRAADVLERGDVIFLPRLAFPVDSGEEALFSPAILRSAKNASYDPRSGRIGGTSLAAGEGGRLGAFMSRFSSHAAALIDSLLPEYTGRLQRMRASFRPAEIAGRRTSWRKDDTRLHVDSFPASPVQGRRILRLFTNVNPAGRPRSWRVGEDFEALAARFAPSLSVPRAGSSAVLHWLGVTKTRRSGYDALMLQLHDRMKEDVAYQANAPQRAVEFPAGTTWIAFTDQVSHAAMAGQYQLEQTFLLPVDAMRDQSRAPLRVLERLKQRRLT
jgi:3-deoxy-D-manno-oct-2-ulosonic acid (Kdo) hydroxylase